MKTPKDSTANPKRPTALPPATGSAGYTLEWQSPDGRWNRMSSSRPTKEGIVSLAKWFFRDWLEMPPMRLIEMPPNAEVSEVAVADSTKTSGVRPPLSLD